MSAQRPGRGFHLGCDLLHKPVKRLRSVIICLVCRMSLFFEMFIRFFALPSLKQNVRICLKFTAQFSPRQVV